MLRINRLRVEINTVKGVYGIDKTFEDGLNFIEELQENKYNSIISYILNPKQTNTFVEVVNDKFVVTLSDCYSRTGSNMLFEYNDSDGNTYVIFFLWNVIGYKVKVCEYDENPCTTHCPIAYFYHADGTQDSIVFGVLGIPHVSAISPCAGLTKLFQEIKIRLLKLDERDLSQEYLCELNLAYITTRFFIAFSFRIHSRALNRPYYRRFSHSRVKYRLKFLRLFVFFLSADLICLFLCVPLID